MAILYLGEVVSSE